MVAATKAGDDVRRVLDDKGQILPNVEVPDISDDDLQRIYRHMIQLRVLDERMLKLQRTGRLGFYMTATGEEATHFAVASLRQDDWIFPSYREAGAAFWRGYTMKEFICQLFGNEEDPVKGRQMPVHHSCKRINYVSISSPVGTQIPQATGIGLASKISGKDDLALAYFGEGTASTGDFHVGLNFAGVFKAPAIFLCRNNGWAISTPGHKQTAAKSIAVRGQAYGMPGIQVDGNDVLAVMQVTAEAAKRARAGEGPTLIEALTYRTGAHSSSDDPTVYRDAKEHERLSADDPIERLRRHLETKKLWDEDWDAKLREEVTQEIIEAHEYATKLGPPALETMFEDVYEDVPEHIAEQRDWLLAQPRTKSFHSH